MDTAKQELLVVAAEAREFRVILRNCGSTNDLDLPVAFCKQGRMGNYKLTCVANGPGPSLVAQALLAVRGKERFDALISTGFCGGLDAKLQAAEIVVATSVLNAANQRRHLARTIGTRLPFATGMIVSQDRVAVSTDEKRNLASTGAIAVEMEAAAVALEAESLGLPFYCVRAVSDTAEESFEIDINLTRNPDGRFNRGQIVAAVLQAPLRHIPGIWRFNRNCRAAETSLGEFFANCSFA